MPLLMLDAQPSGQVIVNTDDIVIVLPADMGGCEIVMRGTDRRVFVPHREVVEVARDLRDPDMVVTIAEGVEDD